MNTSIQKGFTLIELILVIIIIGIIAAIGSQILSQGLNGLLTQQKLTDANWQGQIAIERLIVDIRAVRSPGDILINTASEFKFVDMNGNTIDYMLSGGNLLRNSQILANGVSSLSFSYYDKNGSIVSGTTSVHFVKTSLTISQNSTNYSLSSAVYLRDLSS